MHYFKLTFGITTLVYAQTQRYIRHLRTAETRYKEMCQKWVWAKSRSQSTQGQCLLAAKLILTKHKRADSRGSLLINVCFNISHRLSLMGVETLLQRGGVGYYVYSPLQVPVSRGQLATSNSFIVSLSSVHR